MKEEQECEKFSTNKHLKRYRQKKIKTFLYGWERNGKLLLMLCMCSHHNTFLILYFLQILIHNNWNFYGGWGKGEMGIFYFNA